MGREEYLEWQKMGDQEVEGMDGGESKRLRKRSGSGRRKMGAEGPYLKADLRSHSLRQKK
jgi:hypothetical protein